MDRIRIVEPPVRVSFSHQSKGNQWKWFTDSKWFKTDCFGYEALSEVVVSEFLMKSNINNYVRYTPVLIEHNGATFTGCCSESFLDKDSDIITFERFHVLTTSFSLAKSLARIPDVRERIRYTVDYFRRTTGIDDLGAMLTRMFEVDALFLNEDRHTNNMSLIAGPDSGSYRLSPIYDNGAALFSDTRLSYPVHMSYDDCLNVCKCKPFSEDFDTQLDAAQSLYGSHLTFNMSQSEATHLFKHIVDKYKFDEIYSDEVLTRVDETLRMQIRKYQYMFRAL